MEHDPNEKDSVEKAPEYGKEENDFDPEITGPPRQSVQADSLRQEEFAQELTVDDIQEDDHHQPTSAPETRANSLVGWLALALSIVSFFIMPIILGGGGIILGFVARSRHANTLGTTAIVAGAASILITLFIAPFM